MEDTEMSPRETTYKLAIGLLAIASAILCLVPTSAAEQSNSGRPEGWDRYVEPALSDGVGIGFFPADFSGGKASQIHDPSGYEVRLSRVEDPSQETAFPAGELFVPPTGRWQVWLQGEASMSPFSKIIAFPSPSQWRRASPRWLRVGPAGRVGLPDPGIAELDGELWLLSARPACRDHIEWLRRRSVDEVGEGVLMPAGAVLAGLWDPEEKRFLALSRPFEVESGATQPAPLLRPVSEQGWLVAYLKRAPESPEAALNELALTATVDGIGREADVVVRTLWSTYGVWYGLPSSGAEVTAGNARWYSPAQQVELAGGRIHRVEATMVERPTLDVELKLPDLLIEKPLTMSVRSLPDGKLLAETEIEADVHQHRFESLIHGVVEVVLDTHIGSFRRQVDLTDKQVGYVLLDPELIELSGTVRFGGEPHAARLEFVTTTGDRVRVETDEDGRYEALALRPLRWLTVTLDAIDQEPWRDLFAPTISSSREFDIDIPDADVRVWVVDASTGRGIEGAEVAVRQEYLTPTDSVDEDVRSPPSRGRSLSRSHYTDEHGVVHLPQPRPGTIQLWASADGYRTPDERTIIEIPDPPQDREIELRLDPWSRDVELRLTLPDGSPATGAEVVRVDGSGSPTFMFSGRADRAGVVVVPAEPTQGLLLLRHPATASGVLEWSRWSDRRQAEWSFRPSAGELSVRALSVAGTRPAPLAHITLWLDGRPLSGAVLRWLFDAEARTDGNGFWTARRLPASPLRLLAWDVALGPQVAAGQLDALASEVTSPWPAMVELRVVE